MTGACWRGALLDLSNLGSGEKDLASAKTQSYRGGLTLKPQNLWRSTRYGFNLGTLKIEPDWQRRKLFDSLCRSFHDFDFGGGEAVKDIAQGVNLAVEAVAAIIWEFLHANFLAICSSKVSFTGSGIDADFTA